MAREKFRISIVVVSLTENVYEVGLIGVAGLGWLCISDGY